MNPLVYYYDEAREKRVPVNEAGNPIIDWIEIIPGQKKEQTLYVYNQTRDRLVLRQPYTTDEDLQIKDYPPRLMGEESGIVKLELAIKPDRIDPHKADWGFEVVIG